MAESAVITTKVATVGATHSAPSVVARPALFAVLAGAVGVTLVTAPAGSGKTVLLRSWIDDAGISSQVAWVSIDRGERDAQRFWMIVLEKLRALPAVEPFVDKLSPTPDFDGLALVDRLVAQLGSLLAPVVLVIDDLHELQSPEALGQLENLLARRPPLLRVILSSRHEPHLGLHRLRLSGQLTEIRFSDLRFTLEEARELLARSGISLSAETLGQLHARTEGWAAGLRLATLSLVRHPEPERFVAEFAGSERTIAEYLLAEVLQRQPEHVRRLLLRTAILERVNGALADALVGSAGSERILNDLEAANAFLSVVSRDSDGSWFRYHHLFADLLRLELRRSEPDIVVRLHRLASDWYAEHGYVVEAVRHAQACGAWSRAAQLLVDSSLTLSLTGQDATLVALIASFPNEAEPNPDLALLFAFREMTQGSLDAAAAYLTLAERHVGLVTEDRRRAFELLLALTQLTLARRVGDFASVLEKVQALVAAGQPQTLRDVGLSTEARAAALMNLGIVELWSHRIDEARQHLEQALELAQRLGSAYLEVACLSHLAVSDAWRSFAAARQRGAQAVAVAEAHRFSNQPMVCVALAMLGLMDVSQARFEAGEGWLNRAEATLQAELEPATALLVRRATGMLNYGLGRLEQALADFRAANRLQSMLVTPHALTAQMREWLVLTLLRLGRSTEAAEVLAKLTDQERQSGEARTALACVRLADGEPQAADEALGVVLNGAAPVLHSGSLIEALLVHAIARDRLGDTRAAEADVERALDLADPDGQFFPFVLIRPVDLLERHPRQRTAHAALLSEILDALAGAKLPPRSSDPLPLREELSESELRVLGYLPSNLTAPAIAAELFVSTSTVKTHMRQIYAKLDVHKRSEAVERARELGLLGLSLRVRHTR